VSIERQNVSHFDVGGFTASLAWLMASYLFERARRRLRHSGSNQGTRITQTIRTMMENGTPMRTKSPNV
jgi:hypothetical protein